MINFDHNQRKVVNKYYGFSNLLSKVGGYRASLRPIWQVVTPIFVIGFLMELARIVRNHNRKKYNDKLVNSIEKYSKYVDSLPENTKLYMRQIKQFETVESNLLQ